MGCTFKIQPKSNPFPSPPHSRSLVPASSSLIRRTANLTKTLFPRLLHPSPLLLWQHQFVPCIAAKLLKTEVRFCHSPLLKYPGASGHTQNKIPNLAAGRLLNPISCTLLPCSCSSLLLFGYTKHGLVSGPSHLLCFLPGKPYLSHRHCFLCHFIQAPVLKSPAYFI